MKRDMHRRALNMERNTTETAVNLTIEEYVHGVDLAGFLLWSSGKCKQNPYLPALSSTGNAGESHASI